MSNNPFVTQSNDFDQYAQSLERDLNLGGGDRTASSDDRPRPQSSEQDREQNTENTKQWPLKPVTNAHGNRVKVVTQNENGPCSLLALVNILIMRGQLQIKPQTRSSVDYDYISSIIAEYLLNKAIPPDTPYSLSDALSVLPHTRYGLDLNPHFHSPYALSPSSTRHAGAIALFALCDVPVVHGWVYDRQSLNSDVILQDGQNYDHCTQLIAEGDHLASVLPNSSNNAVQEDDLSVQQQELVRKARILADFIDKSRTQMTLTGLFALSESLASGEYVALFRNSHLSVLYKRDNGTENKLYALVTDGALAEEADVVWETLQDVDGGGSAFLNDKFKPSGTIGGDYVGASAVYANETLTDEQRLTLRAQDEGWDDETLAYEMSRVQNNARTDADLALAMQLQQDENARRERQRQNRASSALPTPSTNVRPPQKNIRKSKKSCTIM